MSTHGWGMTTLFCFDPFLNWGPTWIFFGAHYRPQGVPPGTCSDRLRAETCFFLVRAVPKCKHIRAGARFEKIGCSQQVVRAGRPSEAFFRTFCTKVLLKRVPARSLSTTHRLIWVLSETATCKHEVVQRAISKVIFAQMAPKLFFHGLLPPPLRCDMGRPRF